MSIFIVFEGGEGAGKSTQIRKLSEHLTELGIEHITTREPGGCKGAEDIRTLLVTGDKDRWSPMSEVMLFNAARIAHVDQTISPALDKQMIVLCDRFLLSTIAYQTCDKVSAAKIIDLHNDYCGMLPDFTILLDIDPEVGLARSGKRLAETNSDEDRFEGRGIEYHRAVRDRYHAYLSATTDRSVVISADGSEALVANKIFDALKKTYPHIFHVEITPTP